MSSRKLISVERSIHVYDNDNELIKEINVDAIPFEEIKGIVTPNEEDPRECKINCVTRIKFYLFRLHSDSVLETQTKMTV